MRTVQVAVIQIAGSWRILVNGERVGGFAEQVEALHCAAEAARCARSDGFEIEFLVQDVCGEVAELSVDRSA